MMNPEGLETPEQRLERHRRQILEWQRKSNMTTEVPLKASSELTQKHIEAIMEGIAPVIKRHVAREVAKATVPLERRIAELESKQRSVTSGGVKVVGCRPVKVIGRRPVKVMGHGAVKCF